LDLVGRKGSRCRGGRKIQCIHFVTRKPRLQGGAFLSQFKITNLIPGMPRAQRGEHHFLSSSSTILENPARERCFGILPLMKIAGTPRTLTEPPSLRSSCICFFNAGLLLAALNFSMLRPTASACFLMVWSLRFLKSLRSALENSWYLPCSAAARAAIDDFSAKGCILRGKCLITRLASLGYFLSNCSSSGKILLQ